MDSIDKSLTRQVLRSEVARLEETWRVKVLEVSKAMEAYTDARARANVARSVATSNPSDFHIKQCAQAEDGERDAKAVMDQLAAEARQIARERDAVKLKAGIVKPRAKPTPGFSRYVHDQKKKHNDR